MTKFSDFIRNLGTAGPSTLQGIYNLGFALRSELPALFAKVLRVDQTQSFTNPEKAQGRSNLGLGTMSTQDATGVDISGGSIAGITDLAIADGGTGASNATTARSNLGLGNVNNTSDLAKPISTLTQNALDLKAPLASPALTGNPTAPTASPGDNDTSIATTAFVTAAIAAALGAGSIRAWVLFQGQGGAAIVAQGNVASVVRASAGTYDVTLTTPMPDTNYAVLATPRDGGYMAGVQISGKTASTFRVVSTTDAGVIADASTMNVAVIR